MTIGSTMLEGANGTEVFDVAQLVRECLAMTPNASGEDVVHCLAQWGVAIPPQLAWSLLAAIKTG